MSFWFRVGLFLAATAVLPAAETVLRINAPAKSVALTAEDFAALPHRELATLEPHSKKEHHYVGVSLNELLLRAEAPLGEKMRGSALQLVVLVHSKDGYSVAFSLAELDEAFGDRTVLLADREDGQPLPENAAPFRLVVAGDKRAARWARMVSSIDLMSANALPATVNQP